MGGAHAAIPGGIKADRVVRSSAKGKLLRVEMLIFAFLRAGEPADEYGGGMGLVG